MSTRRKWRYLTSVPAGLRVSDIDSKVIQLLQGLEMEWLAGGVVPGSRAYNNRRLIILKLTLAPAAFQMLVGMINTDFPSMNWQAHFAQKWDGSQTFGTIPVAIDEYQADVLDAEGNPVRPVGQFLLPNWAGDAPWVRS